VSIILNNSVIHHLPKCGGNFVRYFLSLNNFEFSRIKLSPAYGRQRLFNRELSSHNIPHGHPDYESIPNRLVIVREPLSWYRSYWNERLKYRPTNRDEINHGYWRARDHGDFGFCEGEDLTYSDNFEKWIENILKHFPYGPFSEFFKYYELLSSDVGRVENLSDDLTKFIKKYENGEITNIPKQKINVSVDLLKAKTSIPLELEQEIKKAETYIYNKYYSDLKTI